MIGANTNARKIIPPIHATAARRWIERDASQNRLSQRYAAW
jgi:hypothetical protein